MLPFSRLFEADNNKPTILICFLAGSVFLSEGVQKFLYPSLRKAGRFEGIDIPFPEFSVNVVEGFKVICGILVLAGFATRIAVIPMIRIMLTALFTTKLPILLHQEFRGFSLRNLDHYGFLSMMHKSRNDLTKLIGSIFLCIKGGGYWSLDSAQKTGIVNITR